MLGRFTAIGLPAALLALAVSGAAAQPVNDDIAVLGPKTLRADKLPVQRIAIGEPDDYKPCIALLPDGELLLTAFHQHQLGSGKIREDSLLFRSRDGGRSWSRPETLELLGREPYLTALRDGTIFITGHLLHTDVRNDERVVRGYLHRSTDGGKTWESTRIGPEGFPPKAATHSTRNVLELPDGTLLLGADADGGPAYLWRSTDRGKTWVRTQRCEPIDFKSAFGFFGGETVLWRARSGNIVALVRVDSKEFPIAGQPPVPGKDDSEDHEILYESTDEGRTFRRVSDFGAYGEFYPSLLRLQDGRLLLTFTVRGLKRPLGVQALVGSETDDGFAFDFAADRLIVDRRTPADQPTGGGIGPTVQLADGTLVTAYSYRGSDGKTHLEVARWRLPGAQVNPPIVQVKKKLYKSHPRPGAVALVRVHYVGASTEREEIHSLEIRDDVPSESQRRSSSDNGRTWSKFEPLPPTLSYPKGVEVWEGPGATFYDSNTHALVQMWLRQIAIKGIYNCFTYARISRDHGATWTTPAQLRYEEGDEFDPASPLKPSFLRPNQAYFGSNIVAHSNGTLIHCVAHANAPQDLENDNRPWRMGSLCFIGRWDTAAQNYQWTPGRRVSISPERSSRGLMEPEAAELNDGRVLVIWRGSNTALTAGRKWFSISRDAGMTLSDVAELKYDGGSRFYSPSSYHRMFRHSINKKLYWIGNICADPPAGNSPRYPLVVAEVDEAIPALKRSTLTTIDDRRPTQSAAVQFSNFSLLEDRETHGLELYLTAYGEREGNVFDADCYKYTLTIR